MKPTINARLEHVTRKGDRRKPETELHFYGKPKLMLAASDRHVQTLRRALEYQLYRLEAEQKTLADSQVRPDYLLAAIGEEIDRTHDLLAATRDHAANRGIGAMKAGDPDASEG